MAVRQALTFTMASVGADDLVAVNVGVLQRAARGFDKVRAGRGGEERQGGREGVLQVFKKI